VNRMSRRSLRRDRRLLWPVAGIAVGVFLAAGISYAGITGGPGVIQACAATGGKPAGQLRLIDPGQSCGPAETPVTWNATGPTGPTGSPGATGAQGPVGPSNVIDAVSPVVIHLTTPCHPPVSTLPLGVYYQWFVSVVGRYDCVIYTLVLPAIRRPTPTTFSPINDGGYLVLATANADVADNDFLCTLTAGGSQDVVSYGTFDQTFVQSRVTLQIVPRTPRPLAAYLVCWGRVYDDAGVGNHHETTVLHNVRMTAVRVGSVTQQLLHESLRAP
jgi:hypothetical protein